MTNDNLPPGAFAHIVDKIDRLLALPETDSTNARIDRLCEWLLCPTVPSRGLGDTIAKVTTAIGIKPCGGCAKRRRILNERFPYR